MFFSIQATRRTALPALASVALLAGCAGGPSQSPPAAVPEIRPGLLIGYLPQKALPNSLTLVPAPPAAGSAAMALDEEVSRRNLALQGTARWAQASEDANLAFPQAAGTMSCALNAPITAQDTPRLYTLMRRTLTDIGLSTYTAKDRYVRARPFMANQQPICSPSAQAALSKDGSYPSGHSAIGWGWALILSEIAPERTDALLARGWSYGQSRLVCNVHWQSDVQEGRFMGAGTVARLHGDPTFQADLEAAKTELAAVRAKGLPPARDCQAEATALAP